MGTTTAGLPYPEPTDHPQSYPATAQKVAEAVAGLAGGIASVVLTNMSQAYVVVTFPAGRFTVTPKVTLATSSDAAYLGLATSANPSAMRVYAKNLTGSNVTATILVSWLAAMGGPIT